MNPPQDEEVYDNWGNRSGDARLSSIGSVSDSGNKLLWWILALFGTIATAGVLFVGNALYGLNARLASVEAKLEIVVADRRQIYREQRERSP